MRREYKGIAINTSKNTHEKICSLISKPKEAKIADIPCGSGAFVLRLLDNGYKNVVAIDIDNLLEIDHSDFVMGDMAKPLSIKEHTIDVLLCIDGIEHIDRQFDFIKEVNRVLKNNGEFILSTPNISSLRSRWKWFLTGHHNKCNAPLNEEAPSPLHHIGMISYPEIRYMLHSNGFKILHVTTNRIKMISWIYILAIPFVYIMTSWIYYRSGKKEKTSVINKKIKKTMFSPALLFGETIIVKAIKEKNA